MGGKSGASNTAMVDEQRRQADEARQRETERQARLTQGMTAISNAFGGTPVTTPTQTPYDWSTFAAPTRGSSSAVAHPAGGVPAGFTAVQVANPALQPQPGIAGINSKRSTPAGTPTKSQPAQVWALRGPDGQIHYQGQGFDYTSNTPTGATTGGFDQGFYDRYKQGMIDYFQPQVDKQYQDARRELTYRLARAGTLRSSAANTETADLSNQYDLNTGQILNKADTAAGNLRSQVAGERAKAESQLYATEDPDAAASQATSAVRDISLEQPQLSPLGMLFNVANIGGANALQGYRNQQLLNQFSGSSPGFAGRTIT